MRTGAHPCICDRCGMKYKHRQMRFQVVARNTTKTLVCPGCLDIDQPQYFAAQHMSGDPYPLPNARPELRVAELGQFSWPEPGSASTHTLLGLAYDSDMEDRVVAPTIAVFRILDESGYAILQEDGGLILGEE